MSGKLKQRMTLVSMSGKRKLERHLNWELSSPTRAASPAAMKPGIRSAGIDTRVVLQADKQKLASSAPPVDRGRVKAVVWALLTLFTAMFASRVAPLMPPSVGVAVWAMAAVTAVGVFWAFFVSH